MLSKRPFLAALILVCSFSFLSCKNTSPFGDFRVISRSDDQVPKWLHEQRINTKDYIYFIGSVKSEEMAPYLASARANQTVKAYLSEQAKLYFSPFDTDASQTRFNHFSNSFQREVFQKLKYHLKKFSHSYWEHVRYNDSSQELAYHHYLIMRLDKRYYTNTVRRFFRKQLRASSIDDKPLLTYSLERSSSLFESQVKAEKQRKKWPKHEPLQFDSPKLY